MTKGYTYFASSWWNGQNTTFKNIRLEYLGQASDSLNNYAELEYLESDGNQYIDTGVKFTNNHSIEVDAAFTSVNGIYAIYGGANSSQQRIWMGRATSANYNCYAYYGTTYQVINDWSSSDWLSRHTFSTKKNVASDGTSTHTFTTESFSQDWNTLLFAAYNTDLSNPQITYCSPAKLYSAKIWDNGTLVRDYVPVIRKENGKQGLFDKVSNTFFPMIDLRGG